MHQAALLAGSSGPSRLTRLAHWPSTANATRAGTGIVPTAVERVAAQQPPQGQPATAGQPESLDRLDRVGAATGRVAARRRTQRADHVAIEPDRGERPPGSAAGRSSAPPRSRRAGAAAGSEPHRGRGRGSAESSVGRTRQRPDHGGRGRRQPGQPRAASGPAAGGSPGAGRHWPDRPSDDEADDRAGRPASPASRRIGQVVHDQPAAPDPPPAGDHRTELSRPTQPVLVGQHREATRRRSGRQLAAALAAAGGEDGATGPGTHAQAEAVRLGAPAVVRLEGPLAHGSSSMAVDVLAVWMTVVWLNERTDAGVSARSTKPRPAPT